MIMDNLEMERPQTEPLRPVSNSKHPTTEFIYNPFWLSSHQFLANIGEFDLKTLCSVHPIIGDRFHNYG